MKRLVYYALCVLLGILLSFIVHAVVEQLYIALLVSDFPTWSFGLPWKTLLAVHHVFSVALLFAGSVGGYVLGRYWWNLVYVKNLRGLIFNIRSS